MSSRAVRGLAAVLAFAAACAARGVASAHERSTSYSTWRLDGRHGTVVLRIATFDLSRLPPDAVPAGTSLADHLAGQLRLLAGGRPCEPAGPARRLDDVAGRAVIEWAVACAADGPFDLQSALLREVAPSHLHFARLLRPGVPPAEAVLAFESPVWHVPVAGAGTAASDGARAGGFAALGIEHILTGWDHLAFVAALLLGAASLADAARVVTGFTVGHSVTLGLATLGWVRADAPAVEALIGASIALVALESVWMAAARSAWIPSLIAAALLAMAVAGGGTVPAGALVGLALFVLGAFRALALGIGAGAMRWGVASLFGLIHGFGFASVLAEASLEPGQLVRALLGFNLGVEAGQLGVVLVAWPLLAVARRRGRLADDVGNAVLIALGIGWFLRRAFG